MRYRTAKNAYEELKRMDSDTDISERQIRNLMSSDAIPVLKSGNRTIVNMDALIEYLKNPAQSKK